ncbi:MAG: tetratricopeptide repeat protein [Gracilibacteraceae bacterium]|jgi:tetratricopeptide (TPR) repeat protein|nr:tetratricopeptide repeat protein [Gracilibacteraceae bacterium]
MDIWKILGIERTKDEDAVKQAYRRRLPSHNPEDDQEGFLRLREAYEQALTYCRETAAAAAVTPDDEVVAALEEIYADFPQRINAEDWRQALSADVCQRLDTQQEIGEKLLAFLMDHNNLPHSVWKFLSEFFCWGERQELLKEKFPPNYIDYVLNQSAYDDLIRYALFPALPGFDYDAFLDVFFNINAALNQGAYENIDAQFAAADGMGIDHPDLTLLKIRYALTRNTEEAETLAADLRAARPGDIRAANMLGHCRLRRGKYAEARELFQEVLLEEPEHYNAKVGLAESWHLSGNLDEAKNCYWELVYENPYDSFLISAFYDINEKMGAELEERLPAAPDNQEIIYKLASCYHNCRRFADVRSLLADVIPAPENAAKHHGVLAYALLEAGDKEGAEREFFAWEKTEEDKRRLARQIPSAYMLLGLEDKALERCNYYLGEFPAEADIYDAMAGIFRRRGDQPAALKAAEQGLAVGGGNLGLRIHKSHILYDMGDHGGALEVIENTLAEYPLIFDLINLKLNIFYDAEEYKEVLAICQKLEDNNVPDKNFRMYALAASLNLLPQAETAAELREWLKDSPGAVVAVYALTQYYSNRDDYDASLTVFQQARDAAPENLDFRVSIINILRRRQAYAQALMEISWFERNHPGYADAWNLKGLVLENLRRYDEAVVAFTEAIRLDPNHQVAYGNMADVMTKLGRNEQAVELLTKQIEIREHPYYYIARGLAYSYLGNTEAEKKDYFRTIELDPNYAYAYNNLGITFYAEGKRDEAIQYLEQAIKLDPDILAAYKTLGNALAEKGREAEALEVWEKALAHFRPDDEPAVAEITRNKLIFFKERGRYREGSDLLETLVRVRAMDAETMCHAAECFYEQGRLSEAWFWYARALKTEKSKDSFVLTSVAQYYEYAKQNIIMANLYYQKAIEAEPDNYRMYIRRGRLMRRLLRPGRYPAGRGGAPVRGYWRKPMALLDAVPPKERTPCYYYWRAECLRGQGRLAEAEEAFRQALAGAGDYALCVTRVCYDALFGLARLYEEQGDAAKARQYIKETIAIKNDLAYRNFLHKLEYIDRVKRSDRESIWDKLKKLFH